MTQIGWRRRAWLAQAGGWCTGLAFAPALRAGPALGRLALTWSEPGATPQAERGQFAGVWQLGPDGARVLSRLPLPTRAHGLWREASGTVLTVARRPGVWLARWDPSTGELLRQAWAEPGQQVNGHVIATPDRRLLLSTEQDQADGAGFVGRRDPITLAMRDAWPTHGTDAHQLMWVGDSLFVANGGVPSRPETGRAKRELPAMDSSLVRLDGRSGRLLGQWRLADSRLSLRHLAWHAPSRTLGIALQAEHDDPAAKAAAPLLAVFDGEGLRTLAAPAAVAGGWAGYAGDITATAGGFRLSATRAGLLLDWSAGSGWAAPVALAEACALSDGGWALGVEQGRCDEAEGRASAAAIGLPPDCRPDNHALLLA